MDQKIRAILQRFSQGKHTEKENTFLDRWVDKMHRPHELPEQEFERMALRIRAKIQQHKGQGRRQRGRTLVRVAGFCAILALPVSFLIWNIFHSPTALHYLADQDITVTLVDHTTVTLYKGSSLVVDADFNQNNRQVTLTGKAEFCVTKNSNLAFVVQTPNIQTTVLGTRFLVDDSALSYKVKVNEGKVAVLEREHSKLFVLEAQDSIVWKNHNQLVNTLDHSQAHFNFDGKELKQVLGELAAYYQVTILLENQAKAHVLVQGDYPKKELFSILNSIAFIHELSINNQNQTIIIQ